MSSYEISLRKELQRREDILSHELSGRLEVIKKIAKKLLVYTHVQFPYFTPHDFSHSENVEENLNWLIPDTLKQEFHSYEIFFLILSAWFHDWGMINLSSDNTDLIRNEHHIISENLINDKYREIQINHQEAIFLGKICKGHRIIDINTPEYDTMSIGQGVIINIRFLTALVRLADEFDITSNRVPEIIYYQLNPSSKAAEEFRKHLKVIGIAYASEKQRHKLILSATAYDPKGAKTMENLKEKLHSTLNSVKTILATRGIIIDIIELNLTTRGFIYKPIKFEVNEEKILSILIGTHLYKDRDVAFRELIQNSIDSCKMSKLTKPNEDYKIIIKKYNSSIEFEDNGIGMDFTTAKNFLSILGESFYDSDEFRDRVKKEKFNPLARFGIGILSCFLIANAIVVETKKDNNDPCKFSINATEELWKYEKGSLKECGTKIILKLKDEFKEISIKNMLDKYIITCEIPIYYQEIDNELYEHKDDWNLKNIVTKFQSTILDDPFLPYVSLEEIIEYETEDFKVLWGFSNSYSKKSLILFNQGIFVGNFEVRLSKYQVIICVIVKTDIIELKISREDVIYNERWYNFLQALYDSFFENLNKIYLPHDFKGYVSILKHLIDYRDIYTFLNYQEFLDFLDENRFYNSFLKNIYYPVFENNTLNFSKLKDFQKQDDLLIYKIRAKDPFKEINLVQKYLDSQKVYILNIWEFEFRLGELKRTYLQEYLQNNRKKKIKIDLIDLVGIILMNAELIHSDLEKYIPNNVKLAKLPEDLNMPVIIKEKAKVKIIEDSHGSSYWGNLLLMKTLVNKDRFDATFKYLHNVRSHYVNYIELISEPIVYINSNDPFIKYLSTSIEKALEKSYIKNMIYKYFKYLTFLPFIINNFSSNIFALEIIDYFESQLSEWLNIEKVDPLFTRIGLFGKFMIDYYGSHRLMLYDEVDSKKKFD